jgi:hypothetical protein
VRASRLMWRRTGGGEGASERMSGAETWCWPSDTAALTKNGVSLESGHQEHGVRAAMAARWRRSGGGVGRATLRGGARKEWCLT